MFTLGNKEAIVNSTTQYQLVPTTANVALLNIQGFGTFDRSKLVSATGRRSSVAQLEQLEFTCPSAADLGILAGTVGTAVVVHLRVNSLRQASETAIDFIKRGRPLILEVIINGGDTAGDVANAVFAALGQYILKFPNWTPPITFVIDPLDATSIILTATQGYFQINQTVSFLKRGDIFATDAVSTYTFATALTINDPAIAPGDSTLILSAVTGLKVNDTVSFATFPANKYVITEIVTSTKTITFSPVLPANLPVTGDVVSLDVRGIEAINDGKYLEENVRMSTNFTADTYAIQPGEVPIIGATYTQITWTITPPTAVGGWQDYKTSDIKAQEYAQQTYTLFLNETNGLVAGPTSVATYLTTWLIAGGATLPNFKKANGASAESVVDFVA